MSPFPGRFAATLLLAAQPELLAHSFALVNAHLDTVVGQIGL
jgi:hypothetical protein